MKLMIGANLIWLLATLLLTSAPPAEAQQPKKVTRVGYLAAVSASADAPRLEAFRQGLRNLGYVEGQNLAIDYRHGQVRAASRPCLRAGPSKD